MFVTELVRFGRSRVIDVAVTDEGVTTAEPTRTEKGEVVNILPVITKVSPKAPAEVDKLVITGIVEMTGDKAWQAENVNDEIMV